MEPDTKAKPEPSAFEKFDALTRRLMSVPKSEIEKRARAERKKRDARRG